MRFFGKEVGPETGEALKKNIGEEPIRPLRAFLMPLDWGAGRLCRRYSRWSREFANFELDPHNLKFSFVEFSQVSRAMRDHETARIFTSRDAAVRQALEGR